MSNDNHLWSKGYVMNNIEILANALEYMETHLQEDIRTEDVATACYCSKSTLEKMFKYNHISVRDYIIRRRMMLAAKMIIANPDTPLLEIALSCGYSTNESFTRAFKNVWNCNPSEFRGKSRFSELFPRMYPPIEYGGKYIAMRKNVDISEMYELFNQRKKCYFICCDIKNMIKINEISHKAGDLSIIETINRMETEAGEEDIVFRIGGDEFAILTNSEDITYAEDLCNRIRAYNGKTYSYEEQEIPLTLHTAFVKLEEGTLKYRDLYEQLYQAIINNKI